MVSIRKLREHWFSVTLYVAFSVFFLVSGIVSAMTYSAIVRAHDQIQLVDPSYDAALLDNGSVEISFAITLSNPSRYELRLHTATWTVFVDNSTGTDGGRFTLTVEYTGPTAGVMVEGKSEHIFEHTAVVSDPALLADLRGFINYSASTGSSYTLETIPYAHEFEIIAWIGGFAHDYVRESYLNDLVRLDRHFISEEDS